MSDDHDEDRALWVELKRTKIKSISVHITHPDEDHQRVWEAPTYRVTKVHGASSVVSMPHHGVSAVTPDASILEALRESWTAINSREPADWGLFILTLVTSPSLRESVIGDACERFGKDIQRFGVMRAHVIFWWDTFCSAVHFIARSVWRPLLAVAGVLGARRMLG